MRRLATYLLACLALLALWNEVLTYVYSTATCHWPTADLSPSTAASTAASALPSSAYSPAQPSAPPPSTASSLASSTPTSSSASSASASTPPPAAVLNVLFFSDPQIQGTLWELPVVQRVTIRDADAYLWKTFQLARRFLSPDLVVVLGDLLDEGYPASAGAFEDYAARFRRIFAAPATVPLALLAGDNDIGGEGGDEPITRKHTDRFERHFGSLDRSFRVRGQLFVQLNVLPLMSANATFRGPRCRELVLEVVRRIGGPFKGAYPILLMHVPFAYLPTHCNTAIMELVDPVHVFSGHTHEAKGGGGGTNPDGSPSNLLHSERDIETVVPTMSYRMGTPRMAFGVASIFPGRPRRPRRPGRPGRLGRGGETGEGKGRGGEMMMMPSAPTIRYVTCSLPSRFTAFAQYGAFAAVALLLLCVRHCWPPNGPGRHRVGVKTI